MTRDDGYTPPDWWLEMLGAAMVEQEWDDADVITMAREIDGRERPWGPDRISKMRTRKSNGTIPMVIAISKAAKIPSPIIEARDQAEAVAIDRWLSTRRPPTTEPPQRKDAVVQALEGTVRDAKDQTRRVPSQDDERSTGNRRARRTPRGG